MVGIKALKVLKVAAVVGALVCGGGCARPHAEARRLPAWVFQAGRSSGGDWPRKGLAPRLPAPRGGIRGKSESSDFVVAALQGTGLRFGTDGTVPALWGYLKTSHLALSPIAVRPGDVLFFQTLAVPTPAPPPSALTFILPPDACGSTDHVGIVSAVDDDGRIAFIEAREGKVRRSYADPRRPRLRRDGMGRIVNSFLRPKRVGDPIDAPNFAGEMLCGAARPRT